MKINKLKFNSMRARISVLSGLAMALGVLGIVAFAVISARRTAATQYQEQLLLEASNIGNRVQAQMNLALGVTRALAQSFSVVQNPRFEAQMTREEAVGHIYNVLRSHDNFFGISMAWEVNAFDGLDLEHVHADNMHDQTGRFIPYFYKDGSGGIVMEPLANYDTEAGKWYWLSLKRMGDVVSEPYSYDVAGKNVLMTTLSHPIASQSRAYGAIGVQLALAQLQLMVDQGSSFGPDGKIAILSNGGIICGVSDQPGLLGKDLSSLYPEKQSIATQIQGGKSGVVWLEDKLEAYGPITIGNTETPWQARVSLPYSFIYAKANRFALNALMVGILLLVLGYSVAAYSIRRSVEPLSQLAETARRLAMGDLRVRQDNARTDAEFTEVAQSFGEVARSLEEVSQMGKAISENDFGRRIEVKGEHDLLALSINEMVQNLETAQREALLRQARDEQAKWSTHGQTLFAEMLRRNMAWKDLAKLLIGELVHYVKATQGGVFVLNEDEDPPFLELVASYAYDRQKFLTKRVEMGQTLVGTCALEKETIYLTDIPKSYMKVTSGLGKSWPRALLMVPLKLEEQVFGVIELASLESFEPHIIDFVNKIAENIAATLASLKVNERTSKLLERTRVQAEEKAAQEEEMRQNMEELQATQEESARRQAEMEGILFGIDHTTLRAEYQTDGSLIVANDLMVRSLGYTHRELQGKNIRLFTPEAELEELERLWRNVLQGMQHEGLQCRKTKDGKDLWLLMSYTPIMDIHGEIVKVLFLANDINEQKRIEKEALDMAQNLRHKETEMMRKQSEIEAANHKMKMNESVLRKALAKSKEQEKLMKEQNERLAAQEEEMRQNIEAMEATQSEMENKQREIEKQNAKLASNAEKLRIAAEEAERLALELKHLEKKYKKDVRILSEQIQRLGGAPEL